MLDLLLPFLLFLLLLLLIKMNDHDVHAMNNIIAQPPPKENDDGRRTTSTSTSTSTKSDFMSFLPTANFSCPKGYYEKSSEENPYLQIYWDRDLDARKKYMSIVSNIEECAELCNTNTQSSCYSITMKQMMIRKNKNDNDDNENNNENLLKYECYLNPIHKPNGPYMRDVVSFCMKSPICPIGYYYEDEDNDDVMQDNDHTATTTTTMANATSIESCGNLCSNLTECYSFEYNNNNISSFKQQKQKQNNCTLLLLLSSNNNNNNNKSSVQNTMNKKNDDEGDDNNDQQVQVEVVCKKKVCPDDYEEYKYNDSTSIITDNNNNNNRNQEEEEEETFLMNNVTTSKECGEYCTFMSCTYFVYEPNNNNQLCILNFNNNNNPSSSSSSSTSSTSTSPPSSTSTTTTTTTTTTEEEEEDVIIQYRCQPVCPMGYDIIIQHDDDEQDDDDDSNKATKKTKTKSSVLVVSYKTVTSYDECAGYCLERIECTYFEFSIFDNICNLFNNPNHYNSISSWPHTDYKKKKRNNNNKKKKNQQQQQQQSDASSTLLLGSRSCKKHPTINIRNDLSWKRVLYIIPMITGPISLISSFYIVICTITKGYAHIKKPKSQLLLGLSLYDVCSSFAFSFSTNPGPEHNQINTWPTYGTTQTCEAQGFLVQLGLIGAAMYNAALCWYYILSLKYTDNVLNKWHFLPIIHIAVATFAISSASIILANDLFNMDGVLGCYINEGKGLLCEEFAYEGGWGCHYSFNTSEWLCINRHFRDLLGLKENKDCQRGSSDLYDIFILVFNMIPICVCFGLVIIAMILLYKRIRKIEVRSTRWDFSERHSSPLQGNNLSVSRRTINTALLYSAAFILVYLMAGLNSLGIAKDKWKRFLQLLATIFTPLQGFFNLLIFTSPDWLPYVEKLNIRRYLLPFCGFCTGSGSSRVCCCITFFTKRSQNQDTMESCFDDPSDKPTKSDEGDTLGGPVTLESSSSPPAAATDAAESNPGSNTNTPTANNVPLGSPNTTTTTTDTLGGPVTLESSPSHPAAATDAAESNPGSNTNPPTANNVPLGSPNTTTTTTADINGDDNNKKEIIKSN